MAGNIKGITIEIGGDTQKLNKALEGVNKQSRDIQSELKQVERLLKLDPNNTELVAQKQKLLAEAIGNSKTKLDTLKEAERQVQQQFKEGKVGEEQYRLIQREVISTEQNLKSLEASLEKTNRDWEAMGKNLQDVGGKLKDVGGKMTVGVTTPIVAGGAAAFMFAADLQDAMGASDQIFKESSNSIKNWADGLESYYGIAEKEALTYTNTMGAMLQNIGELSSDEASKQAQTLVELAGDLTAMFGGTTESAIQALTGALKGNTSMLDNYGMGVTAATIKSRALEMGLIKEGEELDQASKQAATLALIMEQTAAAQGQAARESEGASGSLRGLTTELKNVATELGEILLPIITPFVAKVKEMVQRFGELSPETKKVILIIAALAAAIGPLLMVIGSMASGVGALIGVFGALTGPIAIVIAIIVALVAAGIALYQNWDEVTAKLAAAWTAISKNVSSIWGEILAFFQEFPGKIIEFFSGLPENLGYIIGLALGTLILFGSDAIAWATTEVPKIIAKVVEFFKGLPGKIADQLSLIITNFLTWAAKMIIAVATEVPKITASIVSFFKELPGSLLSIGEDMIRGLWEGIKGMGSWIQDKIREFAGGLVAGMKAALGIHSPSTVFAGIGENISEGMALGITSGAEDVRRALDGLYSGLGAVSDISVGVSSGAGMGGSATSNSYTFAPGSIVIDAKSIAEMQSVTDFFNRFPQVARAAGVRV